MAFCFTDGIRNAEEERDGCGAYGNTTGAQCRDNCRENCVMPLFTLGKLTIYDSAITPLIGSSTVVVFLDGSPLAFLLAP